MYLFIYLFEREERKIKMFSRPRKVSVMIVVLSLYWIKSFPSFKGVVNSFSCVTINIQLGNTFFR